MGRSAEREISLRSGAAVVEALGGLGYDVTPVVLGSGSDALRDLATAELDVAFLALHGRLGEDGCVQGVLELLGIPYTGSNVLSSALAMDKLKAKELFRLHNVPTPPYYVFGAQHSSADLEEVHGSFGFPVIVQACAAGGLELGRLQGAELERARASHRVPRSATTRASWSSASSRPKRSRSGSSTVACSGRSRSRRAADCEDFHAKYTPGMTDYFMPARLAPARYRNVLNLAERAAQSLDTSGAVKIDLLVTEGQNEYVLEVNTLPGMTETSLLPKIAGAAGSGFAELCGRRSWSARRCTPVHPAAPPRRLTPSPSQRPVSSSTQRPPKSRVWCATAAVRAWACARSGRARPDCTSGSTDHVLAWIFGRQKHVARGLGT